MNIEINEDVFFNIVYDWKKHKISPEEKSNLIKKYLEKTGMSEREFSRKLGISHSTVHDWVSMRQIRDTEKCQMKKLKQGVYMYADRLFFMLTKEINLTDREKKKLRELRELLNSEDFRNRL